METCLKLCLPLFASLFTVILAVYAWSRGNFLNWVNVVLFTVVRNGNTKTLKIRAVGSISLFDLMMRNFLGSLVVLWAARKATSEQPVLEFRERDAWRIRNILRSYVSSLFNTGFLAESIGLPVRTRWYRLCMICEDKVAIAQRRLMLVLIANEDMQDSGAFTEDGVWKFESAHHMDYLRLARRLQETFWEESPGHRLKFVGLELAVPALDVHVHFIDEDDHTVVVDDESVGHIHEVVAGDTVQP